MDGFIIIGEGTGKEDKCIVLTDERVALAKCTLAANEFISTGHCMEPMFFPGDRLFARKVKGKISKGWVVIYFKDGRLQAHRVTKERGDEFWACGDNSSEPDGPIKKDKVLGKVIGVERDGFRFKPFLLTSPKMGLAKGRTVRSLFLLRRCLPNLAQRFESLPYKNKGLNQCCKALAKLWLGEIEVEVGNDSERIIAELLSRGYWQHTAKKNVLEKALIERRFFSVGLKTKNGNGLGSAVLLPVDNCHESDCVVIFSFRTRFWCKGLGLDSWFLARLIKKTRELGYKRIRCIMSPKDNRLLMLFNNAGFVNIELNESFKCGPMRSDAIFQGGLWLERRL